MASTRSIRLPAEEGQEVTCFLYVFADADGHRKVGISQNPESRLACLQTGNAQPLTFELHAECLDAFAIEQAIHRILAKRHVRGEWFRATLAEVETALDAAWLQVRGCLPFGDHPDCPTQTLTTIPSAVTVAKAQ